MEFFNKFIDKGVIDRLNNIVNSDFERITSNQINSNIDNKYDSSKIEISPQKNFEKDNSNNDNSSGTMSLNWNEENNNQIIFTDNCYYPKIY